MTITDTHAVSQPFQAEVSELLHLMVHSVYSETDIFLRELISNASDACDRLRYEAIANPSLIGDGEPPKIRIEPNKKDNTLVVAESQGRRRPDRPVRCRLLFRFHGGGEDRRDQPPRR